MRRYFFLACSFACLPSAEYVRPAADGPLPYYTPLTWLGPAPSGPLCPASALAVLALAALASLPCQCLFQFLVRNLDMNSELFFFLWVSRNCQGQIKKEQCSGSVGVSVWGRWGSGWAERTVLHWTVPACPPAQSVCHISLRLRSWVY